LSISPPNRRRSRPPGFTLAEVLIAIAIFALLVSIIMGSFSGVFSHTENLAVERANYSMARSCLMRMTTDLSNTYVRKSPFFTQPETGQEPSLYRFVATNASNSGNTQARLRFASRAHVDLSAEKRQGIAIIRYYLEAADQSAAPAFRLRRADVLSSVDELPELQNDPIICNNVRALQLEYIDPQGEPFEEWDSESADFNFATPRAVRIRLELVGTSGRPTVFQTVISMPLWRPPSGEV
jgi:general secretion pathway protein J